MHKIFIGTPCYGGLITTEYFKSCMQLVALAATRKIEIQFATIGNESLITRARNTLVQLFMDADLAFNPDAVVRMLDYDKDVVTGIYPRKTIDWIKVKNRLKEKPEISEDELLAASLQYNLNVKDPEKIFLEKGFIEVMDGPTGFMMIKKQVFERMANVYPDLKFKPDQHINQSHEKEFDYHKTSDWNYAFFDTMIEPETRRYLSEDYAFCRLWQNMGGKIYADILSGMTHYGNYAFKGNVGTQFKGAK
jgi:hypothetical protein